MQPDERLELIQEKLDQLSVKRLELVERRQQQPFYYRWLVSDTKLEAINTDIADLKRREENYFKVVQVRHHRII